MPEQNENITFKRREKVDGEWKEVTYQKVSEQPITEASDAFKVINETIGDAMDQGPREALVLRIEAALKKGKLLITDTERGY